MGRARYLAREQFRPAAILSTDVTLAALSSMIDLSVMDNAVSAIADSAPGTQLVVQLRDLSISKWAGELAAIVLLCPILLSIAIWNGFPIIFYDTGAYILEGLGHVFVPERAPVYSLLLYYSGAGVSLWFVAFLQALMTAFVITELARAELEDSMQVWKLIAFVMALVIFTGIGWYVGQIEPDIMTAVMVVAIYLLAFRSDCLGIARTVLLVAIASLAIASHPAHLALAAGLLLFIALVRVVAIAVSRLRIGKPALASPFASLVLAIALVLSANYDLTHKWFISRTGPFFVFARMLQDGLVQQLLSDTCPKSGYPLCKFKNKLPNRADAWLWDGDSPFNALNRFHGRVSDYERIIADSVTRYPLQNAAAALKDTALQFVTFKTGDQIEPQEWVLYSDLAHYVPRQMNSYMRARQQRGELRFDLLNRIHVSAAIVSLLGLPFLLWVAGLRGDWRRATLPAFVLIALLGNAFICGTFSNPHDRYQSRLIWVPFFVLGMLAPRERLFSLQRAVESGT